MSTAVFYDRRKEFKSIDFTDRRVDQRRLQEMPISQEHRRLASQVRRYEREAFKIPVRLQVQGIEITGHTHDICPEGLLVFTDTPLSTGVPMSLKFSFGEHVCHLNVSGQAVFCRSFVEAESSLHATGIKFSGIRDFEKNILTCAVQELKQNTSTHEKSLLNILISTDTLAHEAADFSIRVTKTLEKRPSTTRPIQSPVFERRFSPRIASNLPVRLFPDN
ncbi:MAG: PilZ domain-containing protein, partial [Nitrospira sp.]|nr:PilZ domain-containing protein [Nitrospira sp.]